MFTPPASLPDDPETLRQMLRAALAEIERQRLIIAALQRNRFGRRSEQLDDATVQHGVEDLEQSVAEQTAAVEAAMPPAKPAATGAAARPPRTEPAKRNRGAPRISLPTRSARADQRRSCLAHVIRGRRRHHQVRFSAGVQHCLVCRPL